MAGAEVEAVEARAGRAMEWHSAMEEKTRQAGGNCRPKETVGAIVGRVSFDASPREARACGVRCAQSPARVTATPIRRPALRPSHTRASQRWCLLEPLCVL